jgi:ketosteroid isomerase-like protein
MAANTAEQFIEALRKLEENRDVEALVALYAEGSETGNVNAPEKFAGAEGAREFWTKYRDTFGEVRSTFRNRIITDDRAALEWTTAGTTANGAPFDYEGVSILEIEGDHITRFRAYFDPEALGKQIERAATAGK